MKKTTCLLLIVVGLIISITSCKKDELQKTTNNKSNFVLSDKNILINGSICNQYINNSTGQILYEEIEPNNSTKEEVAYTKQLKETVVSGRSYYTCNDAGTNCRKSIADGDEILIIKKGAVPTN